jgi:hypothetical protein
MTLDPVLHNPDRLSPQHDGAYLSALVLFFEITRLSRDWLLIEFNPDDRRHHQSAADALGISPDMAWKLAFVANEWCDSGIRSKGGTVGDLQV